MQNIKGVLKPMTDLSGKIVEKSHINGEMKGANDYNASINKPSINGVTLVGDAELTAIVRNFTGTLSADGWSAEAPYTQTVAIDGITADMSPIVDIVLSDDVDTAKAEQTAWSCITKAVTGDGIITFYCYDTKPETAINFKVKAV